MSTLDVTRSYNDLSLLSESNLDDFLDDIETLFNTTKLTDGNFTVSGITANEKLIDSTITAAVIANSAVDTTVLGSSSCALVNFTDASIATGKIADSNITGAKIVNNTLTAAKIANEAVTVNKITDANITIGKLAAANVVVSTTSTGIFSTTNTILTDVTNCTLSITTTGGPIFVGLIPDGDTSNAACVGFESVSSSPDTSADFYIDLDSATQNRRFHAKLEFVVNAGAALMLPPGVVRAVLTSVAAGTHTIKLRCQALSSAPSTVYVKYCKLIAWEMT